MTAQFSESLFYEGKVRSMQSEPLAPYLDAMPLPPEFQDFCTACWRRYVGHWEIKNDRLYLVDIKAHWKNGTPVRLHELFPGRFEKIFADWFTGTIQCPQGELLNYVHMGFSSTYERDLLLDIEDGVLVNSHVRDNTKPEKRSWKWWSWWSWPRGKN
jgi:hypothetical protein